MLSIEKIRELKKANHYTNEQLSRLSGVPLGTVQKVMSGCIRSPQLRTVEALSHVFENQPHDQHTAYDPMQQPAFVREPETAYNLGRHPIPENTYHYDRQGTYTLEDYYALPEEQRVELIDGVIYDMGAPTSPHQLIGGLIHAQILAYIKRKKGTCVPFIAPTDVQLDRDNRTMVQPDVMIVCDRSIVKRRCIFGAPDFVAEVLSPSTRNKDMLIKGAKYQNAGVKEYWMIDPIKKTVAVFDFREDIELHLYTFEEKVPILLYNGECIIDFKEIEDYISFITD